MVPLRNGRVPGCESRHQMLGAVPAAVEIEDVAERALKEVLMGDHTVGYVAERADQ